MTQASGKRIAFLAVTVLLVAAIVVASVVILARGPRESPVEVISRSGDTLEVDDLYDGKMTIPYFDIPTSTLKPDDFTENNGVVTYTEGDSTVGIQVNSQKGEIDWTQVAQSGVDFAMVRVGWRQYDSGRIMLDETFEANIQGATAAGLPVGVYFFSKAITDAEAEEEATFVLEQIRDYQISYPVAVIWEYDRKDDGTIDESRRTVRCNGDQVTGFIDTFCGKMSAAGYDTAYLCDKTMGYESLDLSRLSGYDMWYSEFQPAPSFRYAYTMWQYTDAGEVPGISQNVDITIALKKYPSR